jgi:hypothetical protein
MHHPQGYDQQDHLPARPGKIYFKVHLEGRFFMNQLPQAPELRIFQKFEEIFAAEGAPPCR